MRMTPLALLVSLLLQVVPPGPPAPASTIDGLVVQAGTNAPLPGAQVSMVRVSGPTGAQIQADPSVPVVQTDRDGKFAMKDVNPGTYRLYAARNGFTRSEYGQRSVGGLGAVVTVADGKPIKDIVFPLTPAAAVTGRIIDGFGEPLTSVVVELLRVAYDSTGKRIFRAALAARTDDRGEYRLYWVTPGHYYLNVTAGKTSIDDMLVETSREAFRIANQPGPAQADAQQTFRMAAFLNTNEVIARQGYVPTYYPGTTDPTQAALIEVGPGAEVGGINLRVIRQQASRIRGRILDLTGQPAAAATVVLVSADGAITGTAQARGGNFEIRDVVPGSYVLRGIPRPAPGAGGAGTALGASIDAAIAGGDTAAAATAIAALLTSTAAAPSNGEARMRIDVSGGDLDNVVLSARNGVSIEGKVRVEGLAAVSDLMNYERLNVVLAPANSTTTQPQRPARLKADGTFVAENVFPGQYRIRVDGRPMNVFMKEVRAGGIDLMRQILDVSDSPSGPVDLVLSRNAGQLEGTLVDKEMKPVGGTTVILIPNELRMRREVYRTATTDAGGRFTLNAVTPGEYKVFSWEELEPFSYYDADMIKRYEQRGAPVTIQESMKSAVQVTIIPAGGQ